MDKRNVKTSDQARHPFSGHNSYSIAEILAAGGATAFANKLGKNPENIDRSLKQMPEDAFLTEEEVARALKTLNESK